MRPKAETQRLYEEIWRTTFGDSDDFIALYSRTTFDPRRTHLLTTLDQSRALSHVQYLPYLMRLPHTSRRVALSLLPQDGLRHALW